MPVSILQENGSSHISILAGMAQSLKSAAEVDLADASAYR